jgi:2-amino-4-hydroxy-6-hydroxymethyldihydropteridine diphosphokinase
VVIGLGANLGDRLATLRAARDAIAGEVAPVERGSHIYETAPVGPAQPDFLNAAVLVRWSRGLDEMLALLLGIEARMGRVRRERWGPRVLDLDILWTDGDAVRREGLEVPHPRLAERAFAILPLLDVAPDAPYVAPAGGDVRRTAWSLAMDRSESTVS